MNRLSYYFFLLLGVLSCNNLHAVSEQQIIGTQAIGASYHFTSDAPVVEQAKRILAMGSKMIKMSVKENEGGVLDSILAMPFDTYFFWWRSDGAIWENGLSESDKAAEYKATYEFTKKLLTTNPLIKRTYYLGHWEGDWYLINPNNPTEPSPKRIQGMIDWLNIRQKAVEDARNNVGLNNTLVRVYHYSEVNRVRDAMLHNKDRVVNKVLPNANVDYVSYSSYDVQQESAEVISETLNYIEDKLPKKEGITGRRVFIGECGIQAKAVGYDPEKHEKINRDIFVKFLQAGVPYILYWEMYNNEVVDGVQEGFWLINDKDEKQPLYYTLEALYSAQKEFNDIEKQSLSWLKERK